MTTPSDPLFSSQFVFNLIGDIETIWDEYTGAGVSVGVYDEGTEQGHVDLDDNYDSSLQRPLHNSGFHLGQDFGIPEQSNSGCLDGPVFT